jgi:hypothetical protein
MTELDPLGARLAVQNAQFALQKGQTAEAAAWPCRQPNSIPILKIPG